jgi:hypothetical protein
MMSDETSMSKLIEGITNLLMPDRLIGFDVGSFSALFRQA